MNEQPTNPFEDSQSFDQNQSDFTSIPLTFGVYVPTQNPPVSKFNDSTDSPIMNINLSSQATTNRQNAPQPSFKPKLNEQELKLYVQVLEKRNEEMAICLQKERIKNQHFQQALWLLKRQQNNNGNKMHEQSNKISKLQMDIEKEKLENENLQRKYENAKAQNGYLKELILLANNNYENLEHRYEEIIRKHQQTQNDKALQEKNMNNQMQQIKNILASLIKSTNETEKPTNGKRDNLKNQYSSTKSQKQEMEEVYRKMFFKTLKAKK